MVQTWHDKWYDNGMLHMLQNILKLLRILRMALVHMWRRHARGVPQQVLSSP